MKIIFTLIVLIFSLKVFSHADHPPKIALCPTICTKAEIEVAGPVALKFLVDKGLLEKEWLQKKITGTELKKFSKGSEWVITVNDPKAKDKALRNLYIFITQQGILNGVNFTGN